MLVSKTFLLYRKDDFYMMGKVQRLICPSIISQHPSFLDVLHDITPHQHPNGNQPIQLLNNDIAEPWQNVDVYDSDPAEHELGDSIDDGQDINIEDHVAFGVKGLQAEANTMLNPEWTLRLDEFVLTPTAEASVDTSHFYAGILDPMAQDQDLDWEYQADASQQAGDTYLQDAGPEQTDTINFMSTSLQDVTAPSQAQTTITQHLETVKIGALLDSTKSTCSLLDRIPGATPKRVSKRKRIKTALSRKKPRLTPSNDTSNGDSRASKNDLSSRLTLRTEAAKKTTTHGNMLSKHPRSDDPTEYPRVDNMSTWERGTNGRNHFDNAGIVRDIRISESERRPMSWPHRNPWRKSLDISVAVLTKGFERLMTEKGESSPSAI